MMDKFTPKPCLIFKFEAEKFIIPLAVFSTTINRTLN